MPSLTYATRRSPLALAQSRAFADQLRAGRPDLQLDELTVVTTGDRVQDRPLAELGGKGLFVKEIEEALLSARADFAVHSMKDMPGVVPPELCIACVPTREDARDVLVAPRYGTLSSLPKGARVGTSSLRRTVSLRAVRPDLDVVPMRGNVDTRLRKVDEGQVDGIVLAGAGLRRLGLFERATEVLDPDVSLPAIGQGALGIECRAGDEATIAHVRRLHDPITSLRVAAERGVLIALEGDCRTPLAAHATREPGGSLRLCAFVADPDGTRIRRTEGTAAWPLSEREAEAFGRSLGARLK